jgi:ABC-type molybdate transport system substrate-binding protein
MRVLLVLLAVLGHPAHAEQPVRVFAAASLTGALNDVGALWQRRPTCSPPPMRAG